MDPTATCAAYDQIDAGVAPAAVGDTDGDGLADVFERAYGLQPGDGGQRPRRSARRPRAAPGHKPAGRRTGRALAIAVASLKGLDPGGDEDADGLSNAYEVKPDSTRGRGHRPGRARRRRRAGHGDRTRPTIDTDLDGVTDHAELEFGTDPLSRATGSAASGLDGRADGDLTWSAAGGERVRRLAEANDASAGADGTPPAAAAGAPRGRRRTGCRRRDRAPGFREDHAALACRRAEPPPSRVVHARVRRSGPGPDFVRHLARATAGPSVRGSGAPETAAQLTASLDALPDRSLLLVLDDVHELERFPAERELADLLRHRPRHVRIVARHPSPIGPNTPRLMVSGELVELDSEALRFRSWEVEELFRLVYGEPLSPEGAAALTRRTGGWAAGLMLFHLSTSGKSAVERERAVADLGGRSRLVA